MLLYQMDNDNFFSDDDDDDKEKPLEKDKTSSYSSSSAASSTSRSNHGSSSSSQSPSTSSASSSADSSEKSDGEDDGDGEGEQEKAEIDRESTGERDDFGGSRGKDTLSQMFAAASVQEMDDFESSDNIREGISRSDEGEKRGETHSLTSPRSNNEITSASFEELNEKPSVVRIEIKSRSNGIQEPKRIPRNDDLKRPKPEKIRFGDTYTMTTSSSSSQSGSVQENSCGSGRTPSRNGIRPKSGRPGRTRGASGASAPHQGASVQGVDSLAGSRKSVSHVIQMKERMVSANADVNGEAWVLERAPHRSPAGFQHSSSQFGKLSSSCLLPSQRPLSGYSRSLRMLGVNIPPPSKNATARQSRPSSSQSWNSPGKLHTRLHRRTTSLEDVSRVIPQVNTPSQLTRVTPDMMQRSTLTQAVYEEWYFSKASSIRARRNAETERKREEKERLEEERHKKQQRVEAALLDWEEGKVLQKQKQRRKAREDAEKLKEEEQKKKKKLERVAEVYEAWKEEKKEKDKVKKAIRREERKNQREANQKKEARKQEALKVFEAWAVQKDGLLKERRRRVRHAEAELRERKRLEEEDRRVASVAVFNAWKEAKDQEDERKHELVSGESRRHAEKTKQMRTARSLEALEAYNAWLDESEVRHPVIRYEEARSTILANARPPWCPGGSKNVVMNC